MIDVNWTQVIAQAVSSAVIVPAGAIATFVIMRYFPKFWISIEDVCKKIANLKSK
jgi:hypothetical protein